MSQPGGLRLRSRLTAPALIDVALAAGLVALTVLQALLDDPPPGPLVTVVAVATAALTVARRRLPLATVLAVLAGSAAQVVLGEPTPAFASFLALIAGTYGLGRFERPVPAAAGLATVAAVVVVLGVAEGAANPFEAVIPVVYLGGAALVGVGVRRWREALEREKEQQLRLALGEERARIARELHDVVAHGISLMVLQAEGAAAALAAGAPERAREPLERIQSAGREALGEMRRLLSVLGGGEAPSEGTAAPQPGLADVERLVADSAAAGLAVELEILGRPRPVPPALQLAAFRIVQEALTNVRKHARATRAVVRLDYRDDGLAIEVRDDGRNRPSRTSSGGRGLVGMAERVRMFDGEFSAGRDEDGFVVRATLREPAPILR